MRPTKKRPSALRLFFRSAGPGVVTGAADDDPSGIGTYTLAGASFGTLFLWSALITWPFMAIVQMACARIGMVTGEGLTAALEKKLPRALLLIFCLALFTANTLNVGADLAAMADCAQMLGGGPAQLYVIVFGVIIAWATVQLPYHRIAQTLKWLALFLLSYIFAALIVGPHWSEILRVTFFPELPRTKEEWSMLVAILGTTISPYLFYWQASQEVEEEKAEGLNSVTKRQGAVPESILIRKVDVGIGTFFSNLVMYFIILATALTLHRRGGATIETSRQAAEALVPVAGRFASLLYSVGLLGVGFLAIPTLTGSAAYAMAEFFKWDQGLDAKLKEAKAFYSVILISTIVGMGVVFSHLNPLKTLYWSAVINGVLAPFVLTGVLFVMRDPLIMRNQPSSRLSQVMLGICTLMMFGAATAMFLF